MKYCIDTSALMDAWVRWYPISLFPSLWQKMDALAGEGGLVSCEEVLRELERKEDQLLEWAKERKYMFLPLTDEVQEAARRVLEEFENLIDSRSGKSYADPFVIATAMITETIVVTGEKGTGSLKRPKIPDVCRHFNVPYMTVPEMIAHEGWSF